MADGTPIEPEFTIEVVRDPSGCNTDPVYGLRSATPTISVFRRPRPVANTKYTTHQNFGVGPFVGKNGMPTAIDPETGRPTSMNLMADARVPTLAVQAADAASNHLQVAGRLTADQIARIVAFEGQVYTAQVTSHGAGSLVEPDGPPAFGPRNLAAGDAGVLGNNTTRFVFPLGGQWTRLPRTGTDVDDARNAARESIARGHDVFMFRTFWIRDSMHLNTVGLGNPAKRTCATCHGMHMTGMDTANGWMDIGSTNLPWASEVPLNPWTEAKPQMPLFRVTCKADGHAASLPGPRHLHAGPRTRAHFRPVQRRRHDRHAAVSRTLGARALFLQRVSGDAARAGRLLRSPLRHRLLRAGAAGSRELPGGALMRLGIA